jgi:hypothetical protein
MSQYSTRNYFGYNIYLRPSVNDQIRRHLIIPKYDISLVPYFGGSDIVLDLIIKPTYRIIPCSSLKCKWALYLKDKVEPCKVSDELEIRPNIHTHPKLINLGHFSFTNEYRLDLEVSIGDKSLKHDVADIEITSRANMQLSLIWRSCQ